MPAHVQMSEEGNGRRLCCEALHTNVNIDSRLFVWLTKNIPTLLLLETGLSDKALYTNLDIDSGLFLAYENRANAPSDVTFNLRDFRAMLSLCEGLRANVAIRFDAPGQPLVVGPHLRGNEAPVSYGLRFLLPPLRACCIGVSIAAGAGSQPAPARRRDAGELWVVLLRVSLGRPDCRIRVPLPVATSGCRLPVQLLACGEHADDREHAAPSGFSLAPCDGCGPAHEGLRLLAS